MSVTNDLINTGKEEGEAAGLHCDNSSFLSILVCFSLSLSFSSLFKGTTLIWEKYRMTLLVSVCICLLNVHLLYDYLCAGREKI